MLACYHKNNVVEKREYLFPSTCRSHILRAENTIPGLATTYHWDEKQ
jgi:hypothetical protein